MNCECLKKKKKDENLFNAWSHGGMFQCAFTALEKRGLFGVTQGVGRAPWGLQAGGT